MEYLISDQPIYRRLESCQTWRYIRAGAWSGPSLHVPKAPMKQGLCIESPFAVHWEALHFVLPDPLLPVFNPWQWSRPSANQAQQSLILAGACQSQIWWRSCGVKLLSFCQVGDQIRE